MSGVVTQTRSVVFQIFNIVNNFLSSIKDVLIPPTLVWELVLGEDGVPRGPVLLQGDGDAVVADTPSAVAVPLELRD